RLMLSVTRPEESKAPWQGRRERIDAPLIRQTVQGLEHPMYYICGPPSMVKELHHTLVKETSIPPDDVRTELFEGY
ncbi:MAG: oxidoreductase, partial [Thermoplasmata archaeon]